MKTGNSPPSTDFTMNKTSRRLMQLAKKIVPLYAADANIRAMSVTGSVADGLADGLSDVDLMIFYDRIPTELEAERARARANVKHVRYIAANLPGKVIGELFVSDGVTFEASHYLVGPVEKAVSDVLQRGDTQYGKQKIVSGILNSLPLYGEPLIEGWRHRAKNYSDQLARGMVSENLDFADFYSKAKAAIQRDDIVLFYMVLLEMEKRLLAIFCGMNRVYHTGSWKNVGLLIGRMKITPKKFAVRMKKILRDEPSAALAELGRLIGETFALVEAKMPEIDTRPHRFDTET